MYFRLCRRGVTAIPAGRAGSPHAGTRLQICSPRRRASALPGGPAYPDCQETTTHWPDGSANVTAARGDRAAEVDTVMSPAPDLREAEDIAPPSHGPPMQDQLDRDVGQRRYEGPTTSTGGSTTPSPAGVPGGELQREQRSAVNSSSWSHPRAKRAAPGITVGLIHPQSLAQEGEVAAHAEDELGPRIPEAKTPPRAWKSGHAGPGSSPGSPRAAFRADRHVGLGERRTSHLPLAHVPYSSRTSVGVGVGLRIFTRPAKRRSARPRMMQAQAAIPSRLPPPRLAHGASTTTASPYETDGSLPGWAQKKEPRGAPCCPPI